MHTPTTTFISSAAHQVFGCQSTNIESHFDSTYSFIYLLVHLHIYFMSKKCQLLWLTSSNWLTHLGFFFFTVNSLDTKMRARFLLLVMEHSAAPVYFSIDQIEKKKKISMLLLYHELRHWHTVLTVNCQCKTFLNRETAAQLHYSALKIKKLLHMCITLHLPLCSTAVISYTHTHTHNVESTTKARHGVWVVDRLRRQQRWKLNSI